MAGAAPVLLGYSKLRGFNWSGECSFGQRCHFANCEDELKDLPDFSNTLMCTAFVHSGSFAVPNYTVSHDAKELRKRYCQTGKVLPGFGANKTAASAHGQQELCKNQGKTANALSPCLRRNGVWTAIGRQVTREDLRLRVLQHLQFLKERELSARAPEEKYMAHAWGSSDPYSARPWRNAASKVLALQVASEHASNMQAQSSQTCCDGEGLDLGHEMSDPKCHNSLDTFTWSNFHFVPHVKNTFIHFEEMPLPQPRSRTAFW
mmetsp:Transcript_63941/g.113696  ORF Transcript_63941/g.113696 Transcript_63941/m.113696 type:complete len:262 (-) Transcript_63941:80-865(-)